MRSSSQRRHSDWWNSQKVIHLLSGTKRTDPIDRTANPRLYQASSWRDNWSLVERIKLWTGARSGGESGVCVCVWGGGGYINGTGDWSWGRQWPKNRSDKIRWVRNLDDSSPAQGWLKLRTGVTQERGQVTNEGDWSQERRWLEGRTEVTKPITGEDKVKNRSDLRAGASLEREWLKNKGDSRKYVS